MPDLNAGDLGPLSWEEFATAVAGAAGIDPRSIDRTTRLGADLDLDSLALTEVAVVLMADLDMEELGDDLERDWSAITVGELFAEYERAARTTSRGSP